MATDRATKLRLKIEEGETWRLQVQIFQSDGVTPQDITGSAFRMHWRDTENAATIRHEPQVSVLDAANGIVECYASDLATAQLGDLGGVHALEEFTPAGEVHRRLVGAWASDDLDIVR